MDDILDDILDLGPLLDEAMIKYAYIFGTMLHCEYGWREFKQVYECKETPAVLRARFWDVIMPNLERYEIVQQTASIKMKLEQICNPRDHRCEEKTYDHITKISRLQYEDERNAELQRKQFNKPEMLALKQVALDYIKEYTANRDSTPGVNRDSMPGANRYSMPGANRDSMPGANRDSMRGANRDSMPGANRDSMPGPSHSILESSLGGLQFQRMSRGNDDPTITERSSVRNRSHSNTDGTNRLSQGSTSVSATPEMDQSTMEQLVRQSSRESTVRQGSESSRSRSPM